MATKLLAPRCWEWLQIDIAQSSVRHKIVNAMKFTFGRSLIATLAIVVGRLLAPLVGSESTWLSLTTAAHQKESQFFKPL